MKTSTESLDDGTDARGQIQSIICGGGWKNPPKEHHLKIKAICCAFLAVATAAVGISYYDAFGALGLVPASVLLISTILLFWFERPATVLGPQDGDYDIHNLYGQSAAPNTRAISDSRSDDRSKKPPRWGA